MPVALLLALTGGGCVSPRNDDHTLSDGTQLIIEPVVSLAPGTGQADAPSITGLDRSHWPETTYSVPQRNVVHQPTYRSRPVSIARASAVQRGEYPAIETAGESISKGSLGIQAIEAVLAPMQAMVDVVLMVPRAVLKPPTMPVRGPNVPVHRVAHAVVLAPAPTPANLPAVPEVAPTTAPVTDIQPATPASRP